MSVHLLFWFRKRPFENDNDKDESNYNKSERRSSNYRNGNGNDDDDDNSNGAVILTMVIKQKYNNSIDNYYDYFNVANALVILIISVKAIVILLSIRTPMMITIMTWKIILVTYKEAEDLPRTSP